MEKIQHAGNGENVGIKSFEPLNELDHTRHAAREVTLRRYSA